MEQRVVHLYMVLALCSGAVFVSIPAIARPPDLNTHPRAEMARELCSRYESDAEAERHDGPGDLPLCYLYGFNRPIDPQHAKSIYLEWAEAGKPWNYTLAAGVVFNTRTQGDYQQAVEWLQKGMEASDLYGDARCKMGVLHLTGRIVPKDPKAGALLIREAYERGNATCMVLHYLLSKTGEYGYPMDVDIAARVEEEIKAVSPHIEEDLPLSSMVDLAEEFLATLGT